MSKYKKVEAKEHGNILYIPDKYLGHTLSPNCHAFFKRKYSKENYFTNNLGWRVNKLGEKANKVDIMLCGDSVCLGEGSENKFTIASNLAKKLKKTVANIGVGSFSNLQTLRKIKKDIKIARPKIIVYLFNVTSRDFQQNALLDMVHRPFFKKNKEKNKIELLESISLPFKLYKSFAYLEKEKISNIDTKSNSKEKKYYKKLSLLKRIKSQAIWLYFQFKCGRVKNFFFSKIGINKHEYIKSRTEEARKFLTKYVIKEMDKICKENSCKLLIQPIYPYVKTREIINEHYNKYVKNLYLFSKKINSENNIYIDRSKYLENLHKKFFKKEIITKEDFLGTLHWKDNNHPMPKGYYFIAKNIIYSLKNSKLIKYL